MGIVSFVASICYISSCFLMTIDKVRVIFDCYFIFVLCFN